MTTMPEAGRVRRRLRAVRLLALLDLALLIALVASSLADRRGLVQVLGPIHGVNYLMLVAVAATAALDGLWGWWFPLAIVLTAGPPGALLGEWLIARRHDAGGPPGAGERRENRATRGEGGE